MLHVFVWVWAALVSVAGAEPRVALVIGNSKYDTGRLANPKNDAVLMEEVLQRLGFEVERKTDRDQAEMKEAIRQFGDRLRSAGKNAVGLFYFAGHGVQASGVNYLMPVDARIAAEPDLEVEAVRADWVLRQMEFAKNRVNIVILDACRNNPYRSAFRSPSRGLAQMDAPQGALLAYSTAPGQVAADGDGANSPYTAELAKVLPTPGLSIYDVFVRVRQRLVRRGQTPWESSSLLETFRFVEAAPSCPDGTRWDGQACRSTAVVCPEGARWDGRQCVGTLARVEAPKPAPAPRQVGRSGELPSNPAKGDVVTTAAGELVWVPGGTFEMGSPAGEKGRDDDEGPVHQVTVSGLWVMRTEVSQGLYRRLTGKNPSVFGSCGADCPVENVSWYDSVALANRLSEEAGLRPAYRIDGTDVTWNRGADGYRLLTEAEWEYAARGGESYVYAGASDPERVGWIDRNSRGRKHASCGKQRNGYGLCDMTGNVWEWVWDWNGAYSSGAQQDPSGPESGALRVLRGGAWNLSARYARVALRRRFVPGSRDGSLGFRLARPAP